MQSIDSKTPITNLPVNLKTRIISVLGWIYEHTLDYPLVEDKPKYISNLRKRVEENRKTYRIFSSHYNR